MNLFQLVFKQMRQRALGTWLTLLSVLLGVALATSVLLLQRESGRLFGQTDFGYEVLLGPPKGSALTLTLNTVYNIGQSEGNVPYDVLEQLNKKGSSYAPLVRMAVPFLVGDSYKGRRIVGTSPQMFGYDDAGQKMERPWQYRVDRSYEFARGRVFAPRKFEAVLGSDVAEELGMCLFDEADKPENKGKVGSFQATHGMPAPGQTPDVHKPIWHIVGILKPTHTAEDRVLFVPVVSLYAIEEHSTGLIIQALMKAGVDPRSVPQAQLPDVLKKLGFEPDKLPASVMRKFSALAPTTVPSTAPAAVESGRDLLKDVPQGAPAPEPKPPAGGGAEEDEPDAYHLDADGNIMTDLPKDEWEVSAILVKARGPTQAGTLLYRFRAASTDASAVSPAAVMREFFDNFLKDSSVVLLVLAGLVSVVAAVSILVSIYNSVAARQREIAILRALGATRWKVLLLICLEAGMIGLFGGILGLVAGHLLGAGGSVFFQRVIGERIDWVAVSPKEFGYLGIVVLVAILAGFVPAMKAYRTPVATNLVAGG